MSEPTTAEVEEAERDQDRMQRLLDVSTELLAACEAVCADDTIADIYESIHDLRRLLRFINTGEKSVSDTRIEDDPQEHIYEGPAPSHREQTHEAWKLAPGLSTDAALDFGYDAALWDAARALAWDAARTAERDWQIKRLGLYLTPTHREQAWSESFEPYWRSAPRLMTQDRRSMAADAHHAGYDAALTLAAPLAEALEIVSAVLSAYDQRKKPGARRRLHKSARGIP